MAGNKAFEGSHDVVLRLTPALRRFAHALAGAPTGSGAADALLDAALARLGDLAGRSEAVLKVVLYGHIVQTHRARSTINTESFRTPLRGIAQAIERLPLDQRETFLLVVLERFSYDQAGTILGLPRSSVLARLVRARAAIASSVDETPHQRPTHLRVVK